MRNLGQLAHDITLGWGSTMKLDAAALALVGWYLMMAPSPLSPQHDTVARTITAAPLSQ